MSRKTAIIVISISAILLIGALVFFYFWYRSRPLTPDTPGTFPGTGENQFPEEKTEPPTVLPATKPSRLIQLSSEPVAGAVIGSEGGKPTVRYVVSATGRVYRKAFSPETETRLTNTTIPKVYEASWQPTGGGVVLRYLKEDGETIETLFGTIKKAKTGDEGELSASFLPASIEEIALSPDGNTLLYTRSENGGSVFYTTRLGESGRKEILRTSIGEWLLSWPKKGQALMLTKPSVASFGFLANLNPDTGVMEPLISGKSGLTAIAGSGTKILYSETFGASFSTRLFDSITHQESPFPLHTLPEKCVWSPKEATVVYCGVPKTLPPVAYPDAWYQGFVHFTDELWRVDIAKGNTELLSDISDESGGEFDLVEPRVSADGQNLIFVNKNDRILWGYQLGE